MSNRILIVLLAGVLTLGLCACGDDDPDQGADDFVPTPIYSVGGTSAGQTGSMTLQNSNGNQVTVPVSGDFTFSTRMSTAANYNVTVAVPPPNQSCVVANGAGSIGASNVTNVGVTCTNNAFTIGGTVGGLGAGKSVVLFAAADAVSGNHTVAVNGAFTFPLNFAANSEYEIAVFTQPADQTCNIANAVGDITNSSIDNVTVTCMNNSASARNWATAQPVSTDTDLTDDDTMGQPQVRYDAAGNALAVWVSSRPTDLGNDLSFSRRTPGGAWSAPVILPRFMEPLPGTPLVETRRDPRLAVAANGNAVVVWRTLFFSQGWDVAASTYNASSNTWSAPEPIFLSVPDDTAGADLLQIAMNASGNAMVVFENAGLILYNRYTLGSGWLSPSLVAKAGILGAIQPDVFKREPLIAMNAAGETVALWRQRNPLEGVISYYLYSSRYDATADSWSAPKPVDRDWFDPEAERVFARYNLVIDGTGVATALWTRVTDDKLHIVSNRLTGNTWATPVVVETGNTGDLGNAFDPRAAIDGAGNVMAMWLQNDAHTGHYVANRHVPGTGWGTQQNIGDYAAVGFGAEVTEMELVSNAAGDVVALWTLYASILPENQLAPYQVFANEYNSATQLWGVPEIIDEEYNESEVEFGYAMDISAAIDAQGNAVAVWKDLGSPQSGIRSSFFE